MTKILVVNDYQAILESISMYMSDLGYKVYQASNSKAAISLFINLSPEVVILDINFNKDDKIDTLAAMHTLYPLSQIIMITAFLNKGITDKAFKKGAFGILHKPFDILDLEKSINNAIENNKKGKYLLTHS